MLVGAASAVAVAGGGLRGARTCRRPPPAIAKQPRARRPGGEAQEEGRVRPRQGYQVAGVDGYFDDEGRPINARVAKVVDKRTRAAACWATPTSQSASTASRSSVGLGPDETEAQADFDAGEANCSAPSNTARRPSSSRAAAKGWPDSPLEQDALFQLGESYFFAERYPKANNAYEKLIRKYPNSPHLDKVITRQFCHRPLLGAVPRLRSRLGR